VRLKQTTRNLCIHLADVGREAVSFHGFQIRGGFGRNVKDGGVGEIALLQRLRPHAEYATAQAGAIARERKVIFHRRSWKIILIVVMLRISQLESVFRNLHNGIISLS